MVIKELEIRGRRRSSIKAITKQGRKKGKGILVGYLIHRYAMPYHYLLQRGNKFRGTEMYKKNYGGEIYLREGLSILEIIKGGGWEEMDYMLKDR